MAEMGSRTGLPATTRARQLDLQVRTINLRCVPHWRLGDHQRPRSLRARNRETVAIDALGEGDILILREASATLIVAGLFQILLRTDERKTYPEFCDDRTTPA